jgi:murein DD-endopeptidase MepM/ murein hydrolase activator NlpD
MRGLGRAALVAIVLAGPMPVQATATTASDYRLRTVPERVFLKESNAKEKLSGTVFFLVLEQSVASPAPKPKSIDLVFRKGSEIVRTEHLSAAFLKTVDVTQIPPSRVYSPADAAKVAWPHAFRLALTVPTGVDADLVEAKVTFASAGKDAKRALTVPLQSYQQKTQLIFPFRGPGIISVGGVLEGGHRNRSGLYAVDALGLTPNYGPMLKADLDEDPRNYAGWGREIIAPAAGTIIIARNDHVDQPKAGTSDPAYFVPEYPNGGDPGNLVVIDHGNGEFSMMGHMQKGSVRVKPGEVVKQGQLLGLMGNSGDTSGPHIHYQLQAGADWERSDALPFSFTNVSGISRGSYFEAK